MATAGQIKVLIVSDTHGWLDPRIADLAANSALAVHAGDIGAATVLESLRPREGRLVAVRGNNDVTAKWMEDEHGVLDTLPEEAHVELPGGSLFVVHGDRFAGRRMHERLRLEYADARAVIYGHTHRLRCDTHERPWLLNPGAAGRQRTFGGPSCLVLRASESRWSVDVVRFAPVPLRRRV